MKRPSKNSKAKPKPEPILRATALPKWCFRLGAMVLTPLILLAGLEAGLRLAGYGYSTGLFKSLQIGNVGFLADNEDFTRRFFPPQLARWPDPGRMEAVKPANTYRIFILGESAARGEPKPAYAASRYLQVLLNERFPDTHFEVVNLGITAINSHVILPMAQDCAKAGGDLWIIYMGNNEMVGPFGAATVFGAKAPPLGLVRLNLAIQKLRVGQLLVALARHLSGTASNPSWGGMKMFVGKQLPADDPRKEAVYHNFERNLHDIVKVGLDSGVKILLNTVAVNLKDCPPFASLTNNKLSEAERSQFNQLYAAARSAMAHQEDRQATQDLEQAAKLDAHFPELQYCWGHCALALTNAAGAREHFQCACNDDALPFRADSRINGLIRKTARQWGSDRLVLFDAAAALAALSPGGICGKEMFYEHVHFNCDGNYRLALAWAQQVEAFLRAQISNLPSQMPKDWAPQDTCERLLGLTDWDRCALAQIMLDRFLRPPFSNQANNGERMQSLRDTVTALRRRMNATTAQEALRIYLTAIARAPQDHWLHENFAEFLESAGDLKQAIAQWEQVQLLLPRDCKPFYQAGRLLSMLNQWDEAERELTTAVRLSPRLPEGWYELGGVHLATAKFESALENFNRARDLDPQNATYCALAGKALSKLGRQSQAMQLYRQAIQEQPDLWEAHFSLGDELSAAGHFSEAENEYKRVIQLRPALATAHLDRGVMLARLGQFDAALREFQETLRLDPGNRPASQYLERVRHWKERPGQSSSPALGNLDK